MTTTDHGAQRAETGRKRREDMDRVWYAAMSVCLGVVILLAVASMAAVSPVTCSVCHGPAVRGLAASTHAGTSCDRCHAGVGAGGVIEARLAFVDMLVAKVTFGSASGHMPRNANCLLCHGAKLGGTVTAAGIKMSHREVVDAGWSCVTCHSSAGHGKGPAYGGYSMGACLQCHSSDSQNVAGCSTCHTDQKTTRRPQQTSWRVTHGPNWQKTHGMGDLQTCKACHRDDYCARCHGLRLPHPAQFNATHGQEVLARSNDRTNCLVCHRGSSCDDCHGLPMPHPAGFLQLHSSEVRRGGSLVCDRCHAKESCGRCHIRHTHPGLNSQLLDELKKRPVDVP